jgi:Coenzyme PQQ synthesis protein D (PqqD)
LQYTLDVKPKALEVSVHQRVGDEVVVFDPRSNVAHCLNPTAYRILTLCDGTKSPSEISLHFQDIPFGSALELVELTLSKLSQKKLLQSSSATPKLISRRQILQWKAAALLPVITSVLMSAPASAMSCIDKNTCKSSTSNCGQVCKDNGSNKKCERICAWELTKDKKGDNCSEDKLGKFDCDKADQPFAVNCNTARALVANGGKYYCCVCPQKALPTI